MLEAPTTPLTEAEHGLAAERAATLRCVVCRRVITASSESTRVAGAHRHDLANPAGQRFVIGCFSTAPGAIARGEPSGYWSWFQGYLWRVAECRGCGVQLGWQFGNVAGHGFFGLILEALVEADA